MIRNDNIIRIFLLTVLGAWFTCKLYQTTNEVFFSDGIILLAIALIGSLILIWTIFKDSREFQTSKKLTSYFATFIGLLFILINIGVYFYQDSKRNSPTLIKGFYDGGFNGFSVDFKTNGNYIMANGSGLGQSYFYGKYSLKDSTITIDKSNIDNFIKTDKFAIRTEQHFWPHDTISKNPKANYITQIDNSGMEIDKDLRFRVTEDNRTTINK